MRGYSRPVSSETSAPREEPPTPVCAADRRVRYSRSMKGFSSCAIMLGVAIALAAFPAARVLGGRVLGDAADAGIIDTDHDQRLDRAAQNQIVRGDIDAPILAAEGRLRDRRDSGRPADRARSRARRSSRTRAEDRPRYLAAWRDSAKRNGDAGGCAAGLWLEFRTTHQCKLIVNRTCPYLLLTARMSQGMQRQYIKWHSPSLHREMELLAFGDRGFPVLVFPTSGGRFCEYEDRGMVNALRPKIDRGELQVICVDSVDQESWYNRSIAPGGPPAPAECLRCIPGERGGALHARPHQLAADGHHGMQLRRLPCHQLRAAPSRPGDLRRQHVRRVRYSAAISERPLR